MSDIAQLKDWIANPPINRGAAPYMLAFSLEEFTRSKEGLEFLKAFADRVEETTTGRGCRLYRVSMSNLILTIADQEVIVSGIVSDIKLLLLRMIGRMLPDYFGVVDLNKLSQLIDLRRERARAQQLVEQLAVAATDASNLANIMNLLVMEHVTKVENAYKQLGDARFSDLFIRSQQVALQEPGRPLTPVMTEFFVSMSAIRQHLLVGVDMRHNRNVFNQMTVALDRMLLKCIDGLRRPDQRCSINLNVESVFSAEFEAFERRSLSSLRQFNFEFRVGDIMQNFAEFGSARDLIQSRGGTVAIDGLSPQVIGVIDLAQLQANMAKLFWQPGMAPELMRRQAVFDRLRASSMVLALARVDDEEGLQIGRDLKFGLFQGFHVDRQLATPIPTPLHQPDNHFAA